MHSDWDEVISAAENFRMHGTPDPVLKGTPAIFTKMIETGAPNLYEDEQFVLYLNRSVPYPELDNNAGMAFAHLLACPKERIYNAIALRETDRPLIRHMCDTVTKLIDDEGFRAKIVKQIQDKMPHFTDRFIDDVDKFMKHTNGSDMGFYFHIHPNHSVGHLHMHCITNNIRTNFVHDNRNMPAVSFT